jgi:hypothetical protein
MSSRMKLNKTVRAFHLILQNCSPNAEDERRRLSRFSPPRRRPLYPMLDSGHECSFFKANRRLRMYSTLLIDAVQLRNAFLHR